MLFLKYSVLFFSLVGIVGFGRFLSRFFRFLENSLFDNLNLRLLSVSAILSLVYCYTQIDILIVYLLITIPFIYIGIKNITSIDWNINLIFILFCLFILCLYLLPTYLNIFDVLSKGGVLLAHIDFFHHASIIEQITQQNTLGNTQILFFHETIPFYHYGIYIFPAIISRLVDISGINGMFLFVFPYGFLLLVLSIYRLIRQYVRASNISILILIFLVLIVSDTSRAIFNNSSLFDLPYLLMASPGALYGTGIIIYSISKNKLSSYNDFLFHVFIIFLLFNYRVLYIPLYILIIFTFVIFNNKFFLKRIIYLFMFILICLFVSIFHNENIIKFHEFMIGFEKNLFSDTNNYYLKIFNIIYSLLGGNIITFIILSSLIMIFNSKNKNLYKFFYLVILSYLITLLIPFPNVNGDISEFIQRPFVVVNILVSIYLISFIYNNIKNGILFLLIVIIPSLFQITYVRSFGFPVDNPWHISSYKLIIPHSLVDISSWIKAQRYDSVYIYMPINLQSYSQYPESLISAISTKAALISRPGYHLNKDVNRYFRKSFGERVESDLKERYEFVKNLTNCNNKDVFHENSSSIKLHIISDDSIDCLSEVYSSGNTRVYSVNYNISKN